VICENPIPGKIDKNAYLPHLNRNKERLFNLGIKNIFIKLGELQRGQEVTLPDGTVLTPPEPRPGFRLAILGDTYDPTPISELANEVDILIHEATNAFLPGIDAGTNEGETEESVEEKCRSHGHSTPQMAGLFASRISAKNLILNHFSARYAGDDDINSESAKVMQAIGDLARGKYTGPVLCARDLMDFGIQRPK